MAPPGSRRSYEDNTMAGDPTARQAPQGTTRIGRLGRSFQLEGGLHFRALGGAEEAVLDALDELFVIGLGLVKLRDVRWPGGAPVVYLAGVRDRTTAKALTNADVYADTSAVEAARATDPEAILERDLIGLPVTLAGEPVGMVEEIMVGGNNDLLVVETPTGQVLLPLTAPYVRVLATSVELVDPPAGLL